MVNYQQIQNFLNQQSIAVVGVSRNPKKFGSAIYAELKRRGVRVFGVNRERATVDGDASYPDLRSLPVPVGGIVVSVNPSKSAEIVREAKTLGITNIWLQRGSQSAEAIQYCEENGINVIHGHCILMFAEPVTSIHNFHRTILKFFGILPGPPSASLHH